MKHILIALLTLSILNSCKKEKDTVDYTMTVLGSHKKYDISYINDDNHNMKYEYGVDSGATRVIKLPENAQASFSVIKILDDTGWVRVEISGFKTGSSETHGGVGVRANVSFNND